jgi:hypothetical protein
MKHIIAYVRVSWDKLGSVIETLIVAVRQGEMDDLLTGASKTKAMSKARKAA